MFYALYEINLFKLKLYFYDKRRPLHASHDGCLECKKRQHAQILSGWRFLLYI